MTVISGSDATTIHSAQVAYSEPVLNVVPFSEVATASITATPTYPATEYAVSWASGQDETSPGLAFHVKNSDGKIIVAGVQRLPATSDSFFPDVKSVGDGGLPTDLQEGIDNTCTLHVYQHRPVWGLFSRATESQAYKKWDVPYGGDGTRPPPVANMTVNHQAWVDDNDYAVFTASCAESFDWFLGTAGIQTINWTLPSSAEILTGGVSTEEITFRVPKGMYELSVEVISTGSRSSTAYRWIFANSANPDDASAPFSHRHAVSAITADNSQPSGRKMTFVLDGDLSGTMYPGIACVFTDPTYFDGSRLTEGADTHTFVGYLTDIRSSGNNREGWSTTLTFESPLLIASKIPTATQLIEEHSLPTVWTQVVPGLSQPAYGAFYSMYFHSTILDLHNFTYDPAIALLRRRVFGFRATTIGGQLSFLAQLFMGEVNCKSDGSIQLIREPNKLSLAEKNAVDEKFTWTVDDLAGEIELTPKLFPDIGQAILDGISYDGSGEPMTYRAIAPGYAQGQSSGRPNMPSIIVSSGDGQADTERAVGQMFAYENNPLSDLNFTAAHIADICDPADADWHLLNVSTDHLAFDPERFGVRWNGDGAGMRFRPTQVTRKWSKVGRVWVKKITISGRTISNGQRGSYLPIAKDGAWIWQDTDGWLDDTGDVYQEDVPDLGLDEEDFATVVGWNDDGKAGRSFNFLDERVNYENITEGIEGQILDMDWRHDSPDGVYAVAWDDANSKLRVYIASSVNDDPWSWIESAEVTVNDFAGKARVRCTTHATYLAVVAWSTTNGIYIMRKIPASPWTAATVVGSSTSDPNIGNHELGLDIDDVTATFYVPGMSGPAQYNIYRGTGYAGALAAIPNQPPIATGYSRKPASIIVYANSKLYVDLDLYDNTPAVETVSSFPLIAPNSEYIVNNAMRSAAAHAINKSFIYGIHRVAQSDEQLEGTSYTVTEINAELLTRVWYEDEHADPPGNGGNPPFYPPSLPIYKVTVEASISLLNRGKAPIWSSSEIKFNTLTKDHDWNIAYAPHSQAFTRVMFEVIATINHMPAVPVEDVRYIEFRFVTVEARNFGSGALLQDSLVIDTFEMEVDDLYLKISNKRDEGRRLYCIDSSDVWTNITPQNEMVGRHHNSLVVTSTTLYMIATDLQDGRKILKSLDGGTTWTTVRDTTYRWLKRLTTDAYLIGGDGKLDISVDQLKNTIPRIGDWVESVGRVGIIDGALILVETT